MPATWSSLNGSPQAPVRADRSSFEPLEHSPDAPRYEPRRQLGRGGMGEVHLQRDRSIGRDVAMKVIRPVHRSNPKVRSRFMREAQVQGQLEHPAIVPVYDLGIGADGAEYFTMKCLRGLTLAEILQALAAKDPVVTAGFSRRRLLTALSSICLAVDFAHARGVLHRDIKPPNVMLGDFGEVYLLDWGVAKIMSGSPRAQPAKAGNEGTIPGDVLGTPGYMAPEQAWGRTDVISPASDVYALGAILFEILTLERLHRKGDVLEVLRSTTGGADARASRRAPERDVPPELDAICVRATMLEPADRYPSARALHEAIERFLEGDRDVELRRDLSSRHAGLAEEALETALAGGAEAEEARSRALGEVGRALALDSTNERARAALARILTEPPRELPSEVITEIKAAAAARHGLLLRGGARTDVLGIMFSLVMVAIWLGVRDWAVCAGGVAVTFASAAVKLLAARSGSLPRTYALAYVAYVFNLGAVLCFSRGFGPLLFMPVLLVIFSYAYTTTYHRAYRNAVTLTALVVQLIAVGIEVTGILPRSYSFHDGMMIIAPRAVMHTEGPTLIALTAASFFMILVLAQLSGQFQEALGASERRSFLQAWQLRQLLPKGARSAVE